MTLVDEQAERAVLGGMMLAPHIADEVAEILTIADWAIPAHAEVFAAVTSGRAAGEPTDWVAVHARLDGVDVLARAGGVNYLHMLVESVPVAASAPYYARHLADLALRRRLAQAGIRIHQQAVNTTTDTAAMLNSVQQTFHDAETARRAGDLVEFGDGLDTLIEEISNGDGRARGLSTGIGSLDDVIGGMKPGQLLIVGGRPAMGKSVLSVCDMVRSVSVRQHLPSMVVSLEMSVAEVRMRLCAAECSIDLSHLIEQRLDPFELARLRSESSRLGKVPVFIDASPTADIASIRTAARRMQARHGLALLVVDYLQLMTTDNTDAGRAQEVAAISRGLKMLARELEIPVVAAAQLNRQAEGRSDRRPQMSDLRESGSIEADADVVILIHRPDYYDRESPRSGEADLIVAKNRNGPQDTVTVAAQLHHARFVDMIPGR